MSDEAVAVARATMDLPLAGGGTVTVRRLRPTEQTDLMKAAGLDGQNVGNSVVFAELLVRKAVTGGEGVTDAFAGGVELKLKPDSKGLMPRELWDCMNESEVAAVIGFATTKVTEGQAGNSGPLPGGSTGGG